jgi:hypothetical protein
VELQPDHAVVALAGDALDLVHEPERDPLVTAAAKRGGRAGPVGDAPVGAAEDGHLGQLLEDQAVCHPRAVAPQAVAILPARQEAENWPQTGSMKHDWIAGMDASPEWVG